MPPLHQSSINRLCQQSYKDILKFTVSTLAKYTETLIKAPYALQTASYNLKQTCMFWYTVGGGYVALLRSNNICSSPTQTPSVKELATTLSCKRSYSSSTPAESPPNITQVPVKKLK